MKTLADVELGGKTVLLRCELNVAMNDEGVADYTRIEASRSTFERLRSRDCKIVICSHMGRPWGQRDPSKSLRQLVDPLSRVWEADVDFFDDCIGAERDAAVSALAPGGVLLLENVRYYSEENGNDREFGTALVHGIDVYVNDAFGNCHRPHASMVAAALAAPERCAGLLLEHELRELELMHDPAYQPTLCIIGGAKISGKDGKLGVVRNLLPKVDRVALVGKLAYFFLIATGVDVGATLSSDTRGIDAPGTSIADDVEACREVIQLAESLGKTLLLPTDSVVSTAAGDKIIDFEVGSVPATGRALDIGPETLRRLEEAMDNSRLVVWNGPAGFFEKQAYQSGTLGIAEKLGRFSGHAIIGGGDTVAAVVSALDDRDASIHICTGGGAMLTWLGGQELPALAALAGTPVA